MVTPKIREQTRSETHGRAVNRTAAVEWPQMPAAPVPGSPAWWAALRALPHYDPAYPYNPVYEYEDDHTTDPDYGVDGVNYLTSEEHKNALASFQHTVQVRRGRCAPREFTVCLSDPVRQALGPDHEFQNRKHLIPDVAVLPEVFPPSEPLPRTCRLGVDPTPLLVLEVPSDTTWRSDLGLKVDAYAAMGIAEYWLYDAEGHVPSAYADGVSFRGWRLDDTGSYVPIPQQPGKGEWPVYHSEALGADIRMLPAAARGIDPHVPDVGREQHRLQWWDADRNLWRDPEVDVEMRHQAEIKRKVQEAEARGMERAIFEERIDRVQVLLGTKLPGASLAQIEANWRQAGQGRTAAEVVDVWLGKANWRSLLFPQEPNGNGKDKLPGLIRHER